MKAQSFKFIIGGMLLVSVPLALSGFGAAKSNSSEELYPRFVMMSGATSGDDNSVFMYDASTGEAWELRKRRDTKEAPEVPSGYLQDKLFMPIFRVNGPAAKAP